MDQENKHKFSLVFYGLILFVAVVIIAVISTDFKKSQPSAGTAYLTAEELEELNERADIKLPEGERISEKAKVYKVSGGGDGPRFRQVIIDPFKVLPGERQNLYAVVADESGVASVDTLTELDDGVIKELEFTLIDGDTKSGTWKASWLVHDTHDTTYSTTFIAKNTNDAESRISYEWLDPSNECATMPPVMDASGIYQFVDPISSVCDQNQYIGVEKNESAPECQMVVLNSRSLVIDGTTQLVFNPGCEIVVDGTISIDQSVGATAGIVKGYLYAIDDDGDSVADSVLADDGDSVYFGEELTSSNLLFVAANAGSATTIQRRDPGIDPTETVQIRRYASGGTNYTRLADLGQSTNASAPVPVAGDCDDSAAIDWQSGNSYPDVDDDGFGSSHDAANPICYGVSPYDHACPSDPGSNCRLTATDCHDGNATVRPSQNSYFDTPYTTVSSGTSFDYNCDSKESRQLPYVTRSNEIYCSDFAGKEAEVYFGDDGRGTSAVDPITQPYTGSVWKADDPVNITFPACGTLDVQYDIQGYCPGSDEKHKRVGATGTNVMVFCR